MVTTFKYLILIVPAFLLDVIEFLLTLFDSTIVLLILHLVQIILDIAFNLLFLVFFLPSIFQALTERRSKALIIRRVIAFLAQAVGETIPVLDFLPIRTLTLIFMWADEIGLIEKITEAIQKIVKRVFRTISQAAEIAGKIPIVGKTIQRNIEGFKEGLSGSLKGLKEKPLVQAASSLALESNRKISESILPFKTKPAQRNYPPSENGEPRILNEAKEEKPDDYLPQKVKPAVRKGLIIFLLFIFPFFVSAQTKEVYFYAKKIDKSFLITSLFVDPKTKTVKELPRLTRFDWQIPFSTLYNFTSYKNFIKIDYEPNFKGVTGKIILKTTSFDGKNKKTYEGEVYLQQPEISIIKLKSFYFELPFLGKIEGDETITYKAWNFSSQNLTNVWQLNNLFLSNQQKINANLLSPGLLSLEVVNLENRNEKVLEFLLLR